MTKPEDVKLDPRKFDNDMLEETQEPTDDETHEMIYAMGQSVPEDSPDYPAWVAWLAKNHPEG